MKVTFYGSLAQLVGPELDFPQASPCSVADLRVALATSYPQAAERFRSERVRACVDGIMVTDQFVIGESGHVEILPPVSGG